MDCGFAFLGHNGRDLPPRSSGMVVRAFEQRADDRFELPGSPLRIDAERYNQLRRLCRIGLGRDACLGPVRGAYLAGWATGSGPYRLSIDGGDPWPLTPPTSPPAHEWPLQFTLPAHCCDGSVHHFDIQQQQADGQWRSLDETLDIVPHQLTPGRPCWPTLAPLPGSTLTPGP